MSHLKIYIYVGHHDIEQAISTISNRHLVTSSSHVIEWLIQTHQPKNPDDTITVTFIIDVDNLLWINDRHSEHVLCANGGNVLSAGEMTFELDHDTIRIIDVTNQSTGYCPQPESYGAVKLALHQTDISYPTDFTTSYQFRLCKNCNTINIIKDEWYFCGVCDNELSQEWNF